LYPGECGYCAKPTASYSMAFSVFRDFSKTEHVARIRNAGGTAAGRPDSNRGAAASPAVAQAPRPPVRQSPSAAPQPSAASFNTAPSAGGTASGAAANLAALNAAIQGSGASVSAARGNGVAASGPSTTVNGSFGMGAAPVQHQLGNREDSYSTAAGISFDGLGISGASTTSPAGPEPSIAGELCPLNVSHTLNLGPVPTLQHLSSARTFL